VAHFTPYVKNFLKLFATRIVSESVLSLNWSDIDIAVLTKREITGQQADALVGLRQVMLERFPGNPYFRLFEGGMLSLEAFLSGKKRGRFIGNKRAAYC